jgi:hypothetical protein
MVPPQEQAGWMGPPQEQAGWLGPPQEQAGWLGPPQMGASGALGPVPAPRPPGAPALCGGGGGGSVSGGALLQGGGAGGLCRSGPGGAPPFATGGGERSMGDGMGPPQMHQPRHVIPGHRAPPLPPPCCPEPRAGANPQNAFGLGAAAWQPWPGGAWGPRELPPDPRPPPRGWWEMRPYSRDRAAAPGAGAAVCHGPASGAAGAAVWDGPASLWRSAGDGAASQPNGSNLLGGGHPQGGTDLGGARLYGCTDAMFWPGGDVHLVREEGRGVSIQYGREGGDVRGRDVWGGRDVGGDVTWGGLDACVGGSRRSAPAWAGRPRGAHAAGEVIVIDEGPKQEDFREKSSKQEDFRDKSSKDAESSPAPPAAAAGGSSDELRLERQELSLKCPVRPSSLHFPCALPSPATSPPPLPPTFPPTARPTVCPLL